MKKKIANIVVSSVFLSSFNQVLSQDSLEQLLNDDSKKPAAAQQPFIPAPPSAQQVEPKKKRTFRFFKHDEQKERHKKELEALKERQKKEVEEFKKRIENEKKQEEEQKKKTEAFNNKILEKQTEIMIAAEKVVVERDKEIKAAKESDNTVEIISNKEDPLYIKQAQVLKSKTDFMKIEDVEFKYKLVLNNQTPKIISFALIVWERKIAFNDNETLAKEIKVAKPITPYEKRIVEYNELNSRRDGETYKVKIEKIVFEDGTQWNNPALKNANL